MGSISPTPIEFGERRVRRSGLGVDKNEEKVETSAVGQAGYEAPADMWKASPRGE